MYFYTMKMQVISTNDGSKTVYIPEIDENYHSSHGALQEALHVFIEHGLKTKLDQKNISIFEMGFGTGLNAILTLKSTFFLDVHISYNGIEAFPLSNEIIEQLDYNNFIDLELEHYFEKMHQEDWNKEIELTDKFKFKKINASIEDYKMESEKHDIIYFDAFGPRAQSAMWDISILKKMYDSLKPEGIFVTYCAKGQVKRDLKTIGFTVKSLPGPPGKREMTVGIK